MKISDVLAAKGNRVVSVRDDAQMEAILALFDEHNISSAVVLDRGGRLLGIVTDRLIIKALARPGAVLKERKTGEVEPSAALKQLRASHFMQTPAPTCSPDTSVAESMRKMTDEYVRHLVVLDGERLAGIVSIGDLVKARLGDYEMESRVLREIALGHMSAQ
jgi:CBS domain-containing protein